jgi:exopolyphosphatase/guanosine-5'-triphosphate,3'-diphosphate pyrophosphatase
MDLGLTTYDRARIEGHRLTREALDARFAQLVAMPASARLALPGLERGREDLIVPGLAIVLAIMRRLGSPDLTVVDAGLLEGICLTGFGGAP